MSKYYFVVYEVRIKWSGNPGVIGNVILENIHPVVWVSSSQFEYQQKYFTTCLLWWKEIPENVAIEAKMLNYVNVERFNSESEGTKK